jgi:hypothetical protein
MSELKKAFIGLLCRAGVLQQNDVNVADFWSEMLEPYCLEGV